MTLALDTPCFTDPDNSLPDDVSPQGWVGPDVLQAIDTASPFLTGLIARDPDRFAAIASNNPDETLERAAARLAHNMAQAQTEAEAMRAIRLYRQSLALTVALADLAGRWALPDATKALAEGADAALNAALSFALRSAWKSDTGIAAAQGYALIAMGKHGAFELNYSSDIDIIAVFDPDRAEAPPGREMTPHFVRVTQTVAKLLQTHTEDGYAFRVDLRLRPDPGATPVAMTFAGALNYYEALGQNWERAAHIKARPAAGDLQFGAEYLKALRPFIWRMHLDFAAIADIHAMKRQIHAVKGHGAIAVEGHNIKLGRGGIREIEFFVQTQQLIAAGRAPELRVPQTLVGLDALAHAGWIEETTSDDLKTAYILLRSIENRLQMLRDEQTHVLPQDSDAMDHFARFCGFRDRDAFADRLTDTLTCVQRHYEALFADATGLSSTGGSLVFTGVEPDPETLQTLQMFGFSQPLRVRNSFSGWHQGKVPAMRTARARELLTELTPTLFEALRDTGTPDAAFTAFERFIGQLPTGIQLFSMLHANPKLLTLLMAVLGTAPRLAKRLVRRPSLFDAVLDPRFFGALPDRDLIAATLDASLSGIARYEDYLDTARLIGQDQAFLIGVRQLTGNLSHQGAARAYTALAEVLIDRLLARAWAELRNVHGDVPGGRVVVLGMGKLGSCEMTAGSDLDLILIYDHDTDATGSNGARPLAPSQYFARLTQRLIAAIAAQTAHGNLYEVDMRLRPSGRSGPVATRIDAFEAYQMKDAWTWEHMALTRARPVCGDDALAVRLAAVIRHTLCQRRDRHKTLDAVLDMRRRITSGKAASSHWQLKTTPGGLVDIDFIAQTLQLICAHDAPEVLAGATAPALAGLVKAGCLDADDGAALLTALTLFSAIAHRIAVCLDGEIDPDAIPAGLSTRLVEAAELPDLATLNAHIKESQARVQTIFNTCLDTASIPGAVRPGVGTNLNETGENG